MIQVLPFLHNPKYLDPSYKMDQDFWDCFGRKKTRLITEEKQYVVCKFHCHVFFFGTLSGKLFAYCSQKQHNKGIILYTVVML